MAKILLWDIECHTFRFKADQGFMICSGFQEMEDNKLGPVEVLQRDNIAKNPLDDKRLVLAIKNRILKSDMLVTHNGKWFDLPWLNSRLMHWGFTPLPAKFPHYDTCEVAYKKLRVKNSLEALGKFLGCKTKKTETDMNDWLLAGGGNKKAQLKIVTHNIADVKLLREVYLKMRVLGFKHPNLSIIDGDANKCPICGKVGALRLDGWYYGAVNKARRYECVKKLGGCGHWPHGAYQKSGVDIRPC